MAERQPLLAIEGLTISLPTADGGRASAVRGVDLSIGEGEIVGLAGESGSGKTLSALAVLGLLPGGAKTGGMIHFAGRELSAADGRAQAELRGKDVAMVFQDPMTALHPMLSVGRQMTEHLVFHRKIGRAEADKIAIDMLERVRIPNPRAAMARFPHQFSGGMRQRIAIASALVTGPKLLIADEPTTALDVTVQAGILRLIEQLRRELKLSVLLITHDLGVMSALADRVYVMYAGRVVERGARAEVLARPRHPYTRGLLDALPHGSPSDHPLTALPGSPPAIGRFPAGCAFHPRCRFAEDICRADIPELRDVQPGRAIACPVDPLSAVPA
ncbi:oligopeptide/dipeptide ABC transporter ATP-binding protein [Kaistia hirudinis]|uniref:Oligopeptide/dipeptide ABC transporter ATP-binding protein n=1 Tax=Kaistia hirudinis TaxID=1293440 RepID=A0A840ALI1_9HYPH|nr:ABC transporter ATP-binding protein [Kaistia hirudinis]MBB3929326.1 oligopeptide/dipeptide ABC transporter ATP-binding protein [Kaistia hirudinis]